MEAEERPTKLQKRSHDDSEMDAAFLPPPDAVDEEGSKSRGHEADVEKPMYKNTVDPVMQENGPDSTMKDTSNSKNQDAATSGPPVAEDTTDPPMSKNQMKKLRKKQHQEATKDEFKAHKKEKRKEAKARKREAKERARVTGEKLPETDSRKRVAKPVQVPVTILFDCDFEEYMTEKELVSLTAQVTRSYSDNAKYSKYRAHLAVSSYGGRMKDRMDNLMQGHHTSWKGIQFFEENFVEVAEKAKTWMKGQRGGEVVGALATHAQRGGKVPGENDDSTANSKAADEKFSTDAADSQGDPTGETIYLSSDSDYTLTHLSPYSTYIIGGIVDKNRHKGLCYKRALDHNIRTARLPIGQYLKMNSRQVLTTNHVSEIMLKWFETGDWGEAFMQVIPKRKGGELLIQETSTEKDGGDLVEHSDNDCDEGAAEDEIDDTAASASDMEAYVAAESPDMSVKVSNQPEKRPGRIKD